jgi:hypothetical protein
VREHMQGVDDCLDGGGVRGRGGEAGEGGTEGRVGRGHFG